MAERSSAIIYTVGLFEQDDQDANPRVLRRLAQATGGEAFFPGKLNEQIYSFAGLLDDADTAPTPEETATYADFHGKLAALLAQWNKAKTDLAAFRADVQKSGGK